MDVMGTCRGRLRGTSHSPNTIEFEKGGIIIVLLYYGIPRNVGSCLDPTLAILVIFVCALDSD